MKTLFWNYISQVREKSPLVHNITNMVVMNNTANALLAAGASPIMAHAQSEVKDMMQICNALVINMGTLDEYTVESMELAAIQANDLSKPWLFDPVGVGATPYRNEVAARLLALKPTVIRGNASEIIALANQASIESKGVDSTHATNQAIDAGKYLVKEYGSIVSISGAEDVIITDNKMITVYNGAALMTKVTGLGCSVSAVIGGFIGLGAEDKSKLFEQVAAATTYFSICGEVAAQSAKGPGSLQMNLLDTLFNLDELTFNQTLNISTSEF